MESASESVRIAVLLDPEAVEAFGDVLNFFRDHAAGLHLVLFGLCPPAPSPPCQPLEQLIPEEFALVLDLRQAGPQVPALGPELLGKGLSREASLAIGELLRKLANLLRDQEIHSGILDSATDAIITINEDHIIVGYNRGAEKIFGYTREEALGQDLKIIIPPPHKENHKEYVRRYIATRTPRFIGKHVQLNAQRRDGSEFPMSISFSVAEIRGNLYFTGIVRDITEYKQLEERLLQSERLAAVGNTVSHIAHEIKNPLAIIGGFARQLRRVSGLSDKDQQKLAIIEEEVARLEALLAEMRDFVKRPPPKKLAGDLEGLLDEVLALFQNALEEHHITVRRERGEDIPKLHFDRQQMRQVLINLMKNALEAMPQGGRLTVATQREGDNVKVSISDTGPGMTPEVKANIFKPYFTTKEKGTGLGLAICRNILEEHGGCLLADSTPGQGSTFTIQIPLEEAALE